MRQLGGLEGDNVDVLRLVLRLGLDLRRLLVKLVLALLLAAAPVRRRVPLRRWRPRRLARLVLLVLLELLEVGREGGPVLAVLLRPDEDVARLSAAGEDRPRRVVREVDNRVLRRDYYLLINN